MPVQAEILRVPDKTTAHICTSSLPHNALNTNRVRTCHPLDVCHSTCLGVDARVLLTILQFLFPNPTVRSLMTAGLSVVCSERSGGMCGSVSLDEVFRDLDLSTR